MSTEARAPEPHDQASRHDPIYDELHESADFVELRRRFRNFVFPPTAALLSWYLLYVVMSNWADDFMSTQVVGEYLHVMQVLTTEIERTFAALPKAVVVMKVLGPMAP